MEKEKKPDFVVTDRRKFNVDGEPRPDAPVDSHTPAAAPVGNPTANKSATPPATPVTPKTEPAVKDSTERYVPEPVTETGYNGEKERTSFGGQKMEFVHLLDMLVQTAMMYAGAMETGTERRVDIVGLRQMIDLIAVLETKTRAT